MSKKNKKEKSKVSRFFWNTFWYALLASSVLVAWWLLGLAPAVLSVLFLPLKVAVAGTGLLVAGKYISKVVRIIFPPKIIAVESVNSYRQCIEEVSGAAKQTVFFHQSEQMRQQYNRFVNKRDTLLGMLQQRFEVNEMSYKKFLAGISGAESVVLQNTKGVLSRIRGFDQTDYEFVTEQNKRIQQTRKTNEAKDLGKAFANIAIDIANSAVSKLDSNIKIPAVQNDNGQVVYAETPQEKIYREKLEIYQSYLDDVKRGIEVNEQVILQLDKLMAEVSKLSAVPSENVDALPAMQEMRELIDNTKWYSDVSA